MINLKLKQIKVKNFRGISEANFNFKDGLNIFEGRNGEGKSSLLNAIVFGLTGQVLTGNKTNLWRVNQNSKKIGDFSIYQKLVFNKKNIEILVKNNNKFQINNKKINNRENFFDELVKILAIENQNKLFNAINPTFLEERLLSSKINNKLVLEARDWLIRNINQQHLTKKIFDEQKYNEINHQFIQNQNKIVDLKKSLKVEMDLWKEFVNKYPDLEKMIKKNSFEEIKNKLLLKKNNFENKIRKINNYITIQKRRIQLKRDIQILKNDLIYYEEFEKNSYTDRLKINNVLWKENNKKKNHSHNHLPRQNYFWYFLLKIFTFGLVKSKNYKSTSENNVDLNANKDNDSVIIKNLQKSIQNKFEELNNLKVLKDSFDTLLKKRDNLQEKYNQLLFEIEKEDEKILDFNRQKWKRLNMLAEQKKLQTKIDDFKENMQKIKKEKQKIDKNLNQEISQIFNSNIKISFFDHENKPTLEIKENGVSFVDMNSSGIKKLVIKINDVINQGEKISSFIILDNFEMFSTFKHQAQIIAAKVANTNLKLVNN